MIKFLLRLLYIFFVVLETMLGVRFLFLLLNIPDTVLIADWVYSHTEFVLKFFSGTLNDYKVLGFFIEMKTLIAMFVISIINWAIAEVIKIFKE